MPGPVNPAVNQDGTVQVSPSLASAFGPASASAPPPPPQALQPGAPQPSGGEPGFASALMAIIHALFGGQPTTNKRVDTAVEKQS